MARGANDVTVRLSAEGKQQLIGALRDIGGEGEKMAKQLERSAVPSSRGLLGINAAAGEARKGLDNMAGRAGALGNVLVSMGRGGVVAAAGLATMAAAVAFAFSKARAGMDFADEIDSASKRLGIGVEALQEYRAAVTVAGDASADFDDAAKSLLERMGEFARTGAGEGADIFKKLGLDVRDAHGRMKSLETFLPELADKISAVGSEAEQADIANKLFGGQAQNMLAILRDGGDAMDALRQKMHDMGVVMDAEVVARYAEASDKAEILSKAINVQLTSAFVDLAPAIVESLSWLNKFAKLVNEISDHFATLENKSFDGLSAQLDEMVKKRAELMRDQTDGSDAGIVTRAIGGLYGAELDGGAAHIKLLDDQIARAQAELKARESRNRPTVIEGNGPSVNPTAIANAQKDAAAIADLQRQLDHYGDKRQIAIDSALSRLSDTASADQRAALVDLAGKIYDVTAAEKAQTQAFKDRDKVVAEGKVIAASVMDDNERFEAAQKNLNDLLLQGAINSRTYDKALQQAREQFDPVTRGIKEMSDGLADVTLSGLASARSLSDLGDILDQVATQFLEMTLKMVAYQPLQNAASSFLTSIISPVAHTGGVAGELAGTRTVSPLAFVGAERFHGGGVPGLGPNELPVIVQPGEEILTRQDPRHIFNLEASRPQSRTQRDNVTVNVYPVAGTKAEVSTSRGQGGDLKVDVIMRQVEDGIAGRVSQGRSSLNSAVERRYGLNPARSFLK
jgi:hypothetical protein